MAKGSKRRGPPKRAKSRRPKALDLLVFCEGAVTEKNYVTFLHQEYRERVSIRIDECDGNDPLTLVKLAIERKKLEAREERRGRGPAPHQYWCIFDRDDHEHFDEAIRRASEARISVACSCPCIELWFILHFEDQSAHIERKPAQKRSKQLLGCEKTLSANVLNQLLKRFEDAKQRAEALDTRHEQNGLAPNSNPSSRVWRLVDEIRTA